MKLYLSQDQSRMLNEIIGSAALTAVKGKDAEAATVLNELNKRITPQHSYIKLKKYEVEYLQEFVEGIRVSLDDALDFLNKEEEARNNKEDLLARVTKKRDEAEDIISELKKRAGGR